MTSHVGSVLQVRDWVVGFVASRWSKWELVDKMIELEGWKLLLLLRLSPLVPYNLLNITMATTRIHFLQFAITSAVGKYCYGALSIG